METIKAAIIGIGGCGQQTLKAIDRAPALELIALADKNPELAHAAADERGILAYDDYRSLIVEQPIDALFLAVPHFASIELVKLAAKRRIHVWKETPLARNFAEANDLVRAMRDAGRLLQVGTQHRFAPGFIKARQYLPEIGSVYLAVHQAIDPHPPGELGWRADARIAGGGALLGPGYHAVDLLVANLGLPTSVFARTTATASPQRPIPYNTEDAAVLMARIPGGGSVTIVTSRAAGPRAYTLAYHGPAGTITADDQRAQLRTLDGRPVRKPRPKTTEKDPYLAQLNAFAHAILTNARTAPASGDENLANLAVIEAAYLSARTGQPESPTTIYQINHAQPPAALLTPATPSSPQPNPADDSTSPCPDPR